ncbi:hypothetical protein HMPREF9145_0889 [Segatella salivae F0493]|uniref:Uncharacterized protein n=1 Tax=Segatella salivae F0493 TaxID=1395125 RepID=U2MD75_9BACT|nr:hypothetical protein HMPREF9145_0889 [Segatella salivae F0493]
MQTMSKNDVSRHAICIISWCNLRYFSVSFDLFCRVKRGRLHAYLPQIIQQHRAG